MKIYEFLAGKFLNGIDYRDACQLCIWIHLVKNKIPSDQNAYAGEKQELAEAFALLARSGVIRGIEGVDSPQSSVETNQHWLEVIKSAYFDSFVPDFDFPCRFEDIFGRMCRPTAEALPSPGLVAERGQLHRP